MAYRARIRNLEPLSLGRRDELEGVAPDVHVGELLRDLRHVAANAFVSWAPWLVVRVRLNARGARSVRRMWAVTVETQHIRWFQQIGIILRAMHIVAAEAAHAVGIHHALYKVIPLHAILMRRAIGEMHEGLLTQTVLFQFPEILKVLSHLKAHRPVVISSAKGIVERLSLRMALDADVRGLHGVQSRGVNDIRLCGSLHVRRARTVALLTTDVPFRHRLGLNVVVHRMATVTKRTRGPFHVVGRIIGYPPVGVWCNQVLTPHLVRYVPLRAERVKVIATLCEIALFPFTAVHKRNVILSELDQWIWFG